MPPLKVRLAVIAGAVVVAGLFIDATQFSGPPRRCVVGETMLRGKKTVLALRCGDDAHRLEVPPLVAIFHGTPRQGEAVDVVIDDEDDDAILDRPVARHPAATILAIFGVIGGIIAVYRRHGPHSMADRRGR